MKVRNVSWEVANAEIRKHLPHATYFTLESVLTTLKLQDVPHKFSYIAGWEVMTDEMILNLVVGSSDSVEDTVMFYTDFLRYTHDGVVAVDSKNIREYVTRHLSNVGEALFNGDTLLLFTQLGYIFGFHHDGYVLSYPVGARFL